MLYVDTSVFVPFFVPEPTSPAVEEWFERVGLDAVALSSWTLTEFASAIGAKVRMKLIPSDSAAAVLLRFHALARDSLPPIVPTGRDFVEAARLMEQFDLGLRAGDALHLAIARSADAARFVTLDKPLVAAAEWAGLACELPV